PLPPTGSGVGFGSAGGGVPGGGGKFCAWGLTVMVTFAAAELACASLTTSEKPSVAAGEPAGTTGAVNVGRAVSAPASATAVPEPWLQAKVMASPSASKLALPS